MKRSTDRILTTHCGSLIRTREVIEGMKAKTIGRPYDEAKLALDVKAGIQQVVRQQVENGVDIVNDGEYGRRGFTNYISERLGGLEARQPTPAEMTLGPQGEAKLYPEFSEQYNKFYRRIWMLPGIDMDEVEDTPAIWEWFRVKGPITYTGQTSVKSDIATLKSAATGLNVADTFITSVAPTMRHDQGWQDFYPSQSAYLYAVADAMHEEYKAIADSGVVVQVDFGALNPTGLVDRTATPEEAGRRAREIAVEILNHAVRDIPQEQVRYHHCWGSNNRPHTTDSSLREIVPQMLKINAQAYGIEAANPRHEHEWQVWKDLKLPDGKILIPGLISQSTNVVEHPELIAWRIKNFAGVVGKENIIAGVDCGFSQFWDQIRVHPTVQWAKLRALADGAALASKELWGRK